MGTNDDFLPLDGEGPCRRQHVKPFTIDACAVSNSRFAEFVSATGYLTEAERFGWSFVFRGFVSTATTEESYPGASWWLKVEGADWSHPEGPESSLNGREDHPVVHVSWNDAVKFAEWAGGRLPSEAEWEYAARGGLANSRFPWGDAEPDDVGFTPCNIWQGEFPKHNSGLDGHLGTAPVDSFEPNGYGLFNAVGNVWEWCADAFRVRTLKRAAQQANQTARADRWRLLKGGSHLCHRSYCYRYRVAARSGSSQDSSTGHIGFRVAY
jgi:formylglycine-generating enzyme required for sulfatase activity